MEQGARGREKAIEIDRRLWAGLLKTDVSLLR